MNQPDTNGNGQTGAASGARIGTTILDEGGGLHHYEFYTAWSPPIEFLKKVAVQWPTVAIHPGYEEPGMAFKGLAKFQGEIHEDHCISL